MARELEVTVVVESTAAKAALIEIDQQFNKVAASAEQLNRTASGNIFDRLPSSAKEASSALDVVTVSAKESQEVLAALPGTLTKMRGGLNEIAEAAGLTVEGLGAMGAAGLAIGAAYAGWGIGRAIAQFFDLDTAIGNATASLLGYGNVAAETAGAKQDAINLAIQRGATYLQDITNKETEYSEAIKYNAEWAKVHTETMKAALNTEQAWQAELDRHAAILPGLARDLQLHVLTVKDLGEKYGLTQHAIELYRHELQESESDEKRAASERERAWKEAETLAKRHAEAVAKVTAEVKKLEDGFYGLSTAIEKVGKSSAELDIVKDRIPKFQAEADARTANQQSKGFDVNGNALGAVGAVGSPFEVLNRTLADLEKQRAQGVQTLEREEQAWRKYDEAMAKANTSVDQSTGAHGRAAGAGDAVTAAHNRAAAAAEGAAAAMGKFASGVGYQMPSGESLDRAGIVASTITQGWVGSGGPIPNGGARAPLPWGGARDSGGPVSAGTAYYVGRGAQPELFVPSSDGTMTPNGGGGVTIGAVHVHGNVESQAVAERMAQRTAEIVYRKMRGQGKMTLGRA